MAASIYVEDLQKCVQQGMGVTEIANFFSVTPSAITQAMEAHGVHFGQDLSPRHVLMDELYDALELKTLTALDKASHMLQDPLKLSRILQTVNNAKRRSGPLRNSGQGESTVQNVTLLMPVAIQNKISVKVSERKEVTEIDGRALVTMPAQNVREMVNQKHEELEDKKDEVFKLGDVI